MTMTEARAARAMTLLDEVDDLNRRLAAKLGELSDLVGAEVPGSAAGAGEGATRPASSPLIFGEGRKPLSQLLAGELFRFPDGWAFHTFVRHEPDGEITFDLLNGGRVTERPGSDIEVEWATTQRLDEVLDEASAAERERIGAGR